VTTAMFTTTGPARDVLGTGWRFPPEAASSGRFELRSGPALVRQSILVIVGTERGERLMRPDFGCRLRRFLMEPNTPRTRAAIAADVQAAITQWEPRVRLDPVEVATTNDPSAVLVSISYTLVRDQSLDSLQVAVPVGGVDRTDSR
jgi:phage baseplate assembly protein W